MAWAAFAAGAGRGGAASAGAGATAAGAGAATAGAGAAAIGAGAATVGVAAGFEAGSPGALAAAFEGAAERLIHGSCADECQSQPPAASKPPTPMTHARRPRRGTLRLASGAKSSAASTLPPHRLISTGRDGRGGVGGSCRRVGDTDKI